MSHGIGARLDGRERECPNKEPCAVCRGVAGFTAYVWHGKEVTAEEWHRLAGLLEE